MSKRRRPPPTATSVSPRPPVARVPASNGARPPVARMPSSIGAGPTDEDRYVEVTILGRKLRAPDALIATLAVFLGSRLAIVLLGTVMIGLLPTDKKPTSLLDALTKWDGGWYQSIATGGTSGTA